MFDHNVIEDAVPGIMRGIKLAVDLIAPTYGGNGTNVIIESNMRPFHIVANDAQTIIQPLKIKSPAEKRGLAIVQALIERADKLQGDSRKTTLLILYAILEEGYKSALHKKQLKKDLDSLIPFIESEIDKQTVKISVENVKGVATTASESEETGNLLQEIYLKIGASGILNIEGSKTYETSYKMTDGVRFEMTGMLSPEMVHDDEAIKDKLKETKAVYEKPLILVTKKKITSDEDINPLLVEMRNTDKRDLVIFTNDMDSNVASMLVSLHKSKAFNIVIIKAPTIFQNYVFEDFAKCTGSTVVEDSSGVSFKSLQLKHLGTCDKIEVDSEDTILTGIQDITEHMDYLRTKGDDDSLYRLAYLSTKSAVLKLGSNSQTDLSYKRLKANDANRSTYLALQYGVVKGGGVTLWDIANLLPDTEAGKVLCKALRAPLEQAKANYGLDINSYTSLITEDIVDSAMVIKRAVRNAIGEASTILTTPSLIFTPELTADEMQFQIAMKQQNPFSQ